MRIISGIHKGRKINLPKNLLLRPTTDMSKESLMNILNFKYEISSIKIVDLFSGSGNLSYEFFSRGCKEVTAVEINKKCVEFIKTKSNELKLNLKIIKKDVFTFLKNTKFNYDVIFADPPYSFNMNDYEKLISVIFKKSILNKGGCLVIEHSKKISLKDQENYYESRNYGGCCMTFFYL